MMLPWCADVILSVTHLMAENRVVWDNVMWINWSSIYATRQLSPPSLWPCSLSLPGIALQWLSNTLSEQHTRKTHTLSLWHTFYAYFHIGKLSLRPAPPHTHTHTHSYQSQRVLCAFTDWLGSDWRERERLVGGGRWRQQETEGLQRQADPDRWRDTACKRDRGDTSSKH